MHLGALQSFSVGRLWNSHRGTWRLTAKMSTRTIWEEWKIISDINGVDVIFRSTDYNLLRLNWRVSSCSEITCLFLTWAVVSGPPPRRPGDSRRCTCETGCVGRTPGCWSPASAGWALTFLWNLQHTHKYRQTDTFSIMIHYPKAVQEATLPEVKC